LTSNRSAYYRYNLDRIFRVQSDPKNAPIAPNVSRIAQPKLAALLNVAELRKKPLIINQTTTAAQRGKRKRNIPVKARTVDNNPTIPRINTPLVASSGVNPNAFRCNAVDVPTETIPNPRKTKLTAR
jgi:hypothetical protein